MGEQWPPNRIGLSAGKRVLFLTKDLGLIRKQLYEGVDLRMEDLAWFQSLLASLPAARNSSLSS